MNNFSKIMSIVLIFILLVNDIVFGLNTVSLFKKNAIKAEELENSLIAEIKQDEIYEQMQDCINEINEKKTEYKESTDDFFDLNNCIGKPKKINPINEIQKKIITILPDFITNIENELKSKQEINFLEFHNKMNILRNKILWKGRGGKLLSNKNKIRIFTILREPELLKYFSKEEKENEYEYLKNNLYYTAINENDSSSYLALTVNILWEKLNDSQKGMVKDFIGNYITNDKNSKFKRELAYNFIENNKILFSYPENQQIIFLKSLIKEEKQDEEIYNFKILNNKDRFFILKEKDKLENIQKLIKFFLEFNFNKELNSSEENKFNFCLKILSKKYIASYINKNKLEIKEISNKFTNYFLQTQLSKKKLLKILSLCNKHKKYWENINIDNKKKIYEKINLLFNEYETYFIILINLFENNEIWDSISENNNKKDFLLKLKNILLEKENYSKRYIYNCLAENCDVWVGIKENCDQEEIRQILANMIIELKKDYKNIDNFKISKKKTVSNYNEFIEEENFFYRKNIIIKNNILYFLKSKFEWANTKYTSVLDELIIEDKKYVLKLAKEILLKYEISHNLMNSAIPFLEEFQKIEKEEIELFIERINLLLDTGRPSSKFLILDFLSKANISNDFKEELLKNEKLVNIILKLLYEYDKQGPVCDITYNKILLLLGQDYFIKKFDFKKNKEELKEHILKLIEIGNFEITKQAYTCFSKLFWNEQDFNKEELDKIVNKNEFIKDEKEKQNIINNGMDKETLEKIKNKKLKEKKEEEVRRQLECKKQEEEKRKEEEKKQRREEEQKKEWEEQDKKDKEALKLRKEQEEKDRKKREIEAERQKQETERIKKAEEKWKKEFEKIKQEIEKTNYQIKLKELENLIKEIKNQKFLYEANKFIGEEYRKYKKYEEAVKHYANAKQIDKENTILLIYQLAEIYKEWGNAQNNKTDFINKYMKAVKYFKEAEKLDDIESIFKQGLIYYEISEKIGYSIKTREVMEGYIKKSRERFKIFLNTKFYQRLSEENKIKYDLKNKIEIINKVLKENETILEKVMNIFAAAFVLNNIKNEFITKNELLSAVKELEKVVKNNSYINKEIYFLIGNIYHRLAVQNNKKNIKYFKKSLEYYKYACENKKHIQDIKKVTSYIEQYLNKFINKKNKINKENKIKKIDIVGNDSIYLNMGNIYFCIKNFSNAEKYLLMALKEGTADPDLYGQLCEIYFMQGQYKNFLIYFKQAKVKYSKNGIDPYMYYLKGCVYSYFKEYKKALKIFNFAKKMKKNNIEFWLSNIREKELNIYEAISLYYEKQYENTIKYIENKGKNNYFKKEIFILARAYFMNKQYDKAEQNFIKVYDLNQSENEFNEFSSEYYSFVKEVYNTNKEVFKKEILKSLNFFIKKMEKQKSVFLTNFYYMKYVICKNLGEKYKKQKDEMFQKLKENKFDFFDYYIDEVELLNIKIYDIEDPFKKDDQYYDVGILFDELKKNNKVEYNEKNMLDDNISKIGEIIKKCEIEEKYIKEIQEIFLNCNILYVLVDQIFFRYDNQIKHELIYDLSTLAQVLIDNKKTNKSAIGITKGLLEFTKKWTKEYQDLFWSLIITFKLGLFKAVENWDKPTEDKLKKLQYDQFLMIKITMLFEELNKKNEFKDKVITHEQIMKHIENKLKGTILDLKTYKPVVLDIDEFVTALEKSA